MPALSPVPQDPSESDSLAGRLAQSDRESDLVRVLKTAIQGEVITLNEIARRTGVSDGQLSRFLRSQRTIALRVAAKLGEHFGLRPIVSDDHL